MSKEITKEQLIIINDMLNTWVDDPDRYGESFKEDCRRLLATCDPSPKVMTAEILRRTLSYDPSTGEFRWIDRASKNTIIGSLAGTIVGNGYRMIRMLGKQAFYAHRLAYLYMTGEWPPDQIDHIDGNPANNRWSNLRASTQTQNMGNTITPSHNTSGSKGVCWDKRRQQWRAYIVVSRKQRSLGYFTSKHDAAMAYARAANEVFGEFARTA